MEIVYSPMQAREAEAVSAMIALVFEVFLANETPEEGKEAFAEARAADKLRAYALNPQHILWLAKVDEKIVGMIEIHESKHLRLLFVHPAYHRLGIAKKLLHLALEKSKKHNPNLVQLTVKSSPYAVSFYEQQGFVKVGNWENKRGIRHLPMILKLA